jgi:hypothetical protein
MTWVAEIEKSLTDAVDSWALGCLGEDPERIQRSIGFFYDNRPSTIDHDSVAAFTDAMLRRLRQLERNSVRGSSRLQ